MDEKRKPTIEVREVHVDQPRRTAVEVLANPPKLFSEDTVPPAELPSLPRNGSKGSK